MAIAPAAPPLQLDSRAWEQCVCSLQRELGRIATREDCQDAVQDALVDALAHPDLSVENLAGWVLVIARRRLLDRHRATVGRSQDRRKRRRFVTVHEEFADARISEAELVELLEDGASAEASEAMRRLSAEQQRLLTLALERTRYPEVAAVLGITPKAAKARTLRAWGALREAFIDTERDAACGGVRGLLVRRRSRGAAGVAEQQRLLAHLELCAPCRAYEKRLKGLIATSPAPSLPFWQQLLLRAEQFLVGAPGPRGVEAAAAGALTAGGTTGALPRMLAALCATATAAVCTIVAVRPDPPRPSSPARPTATPTVAQARASATPTASPRATVTASRTPAPRTRQRASKDTDGVTGDVRRDTRSATAPRPASAPAGSTSTSEFTPGGAGSSATAAPAPAPAAGGGEFRP